MEAKSMYEDKEGETVRLVPTQGAYQDTLDGKVERVTKTQVVVSSERKPYGMTFRRADGLPAFKVDRGFPCYKVEPASTKRKR